jgi:hypothetical protein
VTRVMETIRGEAWVKYVVKKNRSFLSEQDRKKKC